MNQIKIRFMLVVLKYIQTEIRGRQFLEIECHDLIRTLQQKFLEE